ncbi:DUF2312 domain-containing protein [Bradyrhizobium sp. HKCCYLR1051]|uniref:DUF2312 domain-containing protein n=1 Tax=Bradyrhizobium sp. HKCCYLR1051 TaxID=3420738 RepID=UPI003EB8A94A
MTEQQFRARTAEIVRRNREKADVSSNTGTNVAVDQLTLIVERIERIEAEKKGLSDDVKEIYQEAKGNGFEAKAIRRIVRLRAMDASQKAAHEEVESILETYMQALGML